MIYLDSHTHVTECSFSTLEMMNLTGIRKVVSPVNWSSKEPVPASTIVDVWEHQIDYQLPRLGKMLIDSYAMIGVSMVSVPVDWEKLLEKLPAYLENPKVVAIGEIGFQPGSRTCKDIAVQETIVKEQIKIARELKIPVVFHVPEGEEKKEYTGRTLELCKEGNLPMSAVLIDHCSDSNIDMVLEAGATCGISVQPWRNLSPKNAADLILDRAPDRICVNSDASTRESDPIAVARVAYELKKKGASDELIEKVCCTNGKEFYNI